MQFIRQKGSIVPALVLLLAALLVGLLAASRFRGSTRSTTPGPSQPTSPFVDSNATSALIYGIRLGSHAEVRQINSDGTNDGIVAKLDKGARDVNILNDHELVYIAGVSFDEGQFGRGKRIERAVTSQDPLAVTKLYELPESESWGIDELIVSPDKQYIAWWEVKNPPGVLDHSKYSSRTYVMPLGGGAKTKIAEESDTQNLKTKPLFFDSQNRLYLDTVAQNPYDFFLGLKRFSITGQDLGTVLTDGSYNSFPVVSPDGQYAVYTMYDGTDPKKDAGQLHSTRVTSVNPNTLVLLNLTNDQKTTVGNSSSNAQYDLHIVWSYDSKGFAYIKQRVTQYNPIVKVLGNGIWRYKVGDRDPSRLHDSTVYQDDVREYVLGYDVQADTVLYGPRNLNDKGNLGPTVSAPVFKEIDAYSPSFGAQPKQYATGGGFERIAMEGKDRSKRFSMRVPEKVIVDARQLKLKDFELPSPPPPRTQPGKNPRGDCTNNWQQMGYPSPEICELCPLYLYPVKETQVSVVVKNARVTSSNFPYDTQAFEVTALPGSKLIRRDGLALPNIAYEYITKNVAPPKNGFVIRSGQLPTILWWYAVNLGLNNQETQDFVAFWQQKLPQSPYYFMSHYSHEQVLEQLELNITPKPDTLIQVIMYFRPLPIPMLAQPPIFDTLPDRTGFVAVDFSGRIDNDTIPSTD